MHNSDKTPAYANCPFCAGTGRGKTVRRGRLDQCLTCSGTGKILLRQVALIEGKVDNVKYTEKEKAVERAELLDQFIDDHVECYLHRPGRVRGCTTSNCDLWRSNLGGCQRFKIMKLMDLGTRAGSPSFRVAEKKILAEIYGVSETEPVPPPAALIEETNKE